MPNMALNRSAVINTVLFFQLSVPLYLKPRQGGFTRDGQKRMVYNRASSTHRRTKGARSQVQKGLSNRFRSLAYVRLVSGKWGRRGEAEQPVVTGETNAAPKKPSPAKKAPKKVQAVAHKPPAAVPDIAMPERVGLTAGKIWHYLADKGATSVATLVRELPEEEKIIQRSIGWLAQEGNIMLDTVGRIETIALKA